MSINIAIIPARRNSKRIVQKNMVGLGQKPLIAWTLDAGINCDLFDRIVVTTDDLDVMDLRSYYSSVHFMLRESHLAEDHVHSVFPTLDAAQKVNAQDDDVISMMLPTSPFRDVASIKLGLGIANAQHLKQLHGSGLSAIGVIQRKKVASYRVRNDVFLKYLPVAPLHEEPILEVTGSLFMTRYKTLKKHKTFHVSNVIGVEVSHHESIEIDTYNDLDFARKLIKGEGFAN